MAEGDGISNRAYCRTCHEDDRIGTIRRKKRKRGTLLGILLWRKRKKPPPRILEEERRKASLMGRGRNGPGRRHPSNGNAPRTCAGVHCGNRCHCNRGFCGVHAEKKKEKRKLTPKVKRDRIDFLPLFTCNASRTAKSAIYGDFSWNAGKIMPNICKIVTQGKFKLYGNASRPSPKAKGKEKENPPGKAITP